MKSPSKTYVALTEVHKNVNEKEFMFGKFISMADKNMLTQSVTFCLLWKVV